VSAEASLRTTYPNLVFRTAFPGLKMPHPASETQPYSSVVLTGRIRVQIFGSPGARDSRCGLPDSLFGSELQRERCFPLLCRRFRVTTFAT
jgi:hypothetical protein